MVPSSLHSYTEAKATFIIKKKAERQVSNEENSSLNLLKLLFEIRQFQQHVWAFYERLKKHFFSQTFSCSILIENFSEHLVFFPFFVKIKSSVKIAQALVILTFSLWLLSEPVFRLFLLFWRSFSRKRKIANFAVFWLVLWENISGPPNWCIRARVHEKISVATLYNVYTINLI